MTQKSNGILKKNKKNFEKSIDKSKIWVYNATHRGKEAQRELISFGILAFFVSKS